MRSFVFFYLLRVVFRAVLVRKRINVELIDKLLVRGFQRPLVSAAVLRRL
jgi:hypothetical protein